MKIKSILLITIAGCALHNSNLLCASQNPDPKKPILPSPLQLAGILAQTEKPKSPKEEKQRAPSPAPKKDPILEGMRKEYGGLMRWWGL